MNIIIGRDAATSRLKVTDGNSGSSKLFGNAGSVPQDVSRQHCEVTISDDGKITIKNLKVTNITYVNGLEVLSKSISKSDTVELGHSRYRIDLSSIITELTPKVADIRPLKKVWEEYNNTLQQLGVKERQLNALSRVSGVFSMCAIASGFLLKGQDNQLYYILYGAAILLTVGFTIISYINASKIPKQKEELKEKFIKDYTCPACKHFLGVTYYSVLSQNTCCQYCKTKFKK